MNRLFFTVVAVLFCSFSRLPATTSYLLVEGGGLPSSRWEVQYIGSQLLTGQDLLDIIFGVPVVTGAPINGQTYSSTNGQNGALYPYSAVYGFYPSRFTIDGLQGEETPPNFSSYWSYFNAGGGYNDTSGTGYNDPLAGPYDGAVWAYSNTGPRDRLLGDQSNTGAPSFDAFIFGNGDVPSLLPMISAFDGATVINLNAAPEPGRFMLLAIGAATILLRRNRRTYF